MFRGIVVRIIVFIAVPWAFLNPFQGVLWYLWYSHFRPEDFIWPGWKFKAGALLIAGATLLGYVFFEMHNSPPRWRGLVLMTCFYLWIVLAAVFASDKALAFWKVSQYTNIVIMTFVVAALANSAERIKAMLTVMGVSVGLLGLRATVEFLLTGGQFKVVGVGGVELEGNEFALALNMGLSILMCLSYAEPRRWLRYTFRVLGVCCITAVIGTFSRSGFLGLACALLLLAWYSKRRFLSLAALAVAGLLAVPLIPQNALTRWKSIPTAAELDPSAIDRIETWETGLGMIRAHPVLGVGPSCFQENYSHYYLQKYLGAANYRPRAPHNVYVCLSAESGIPSMLLFVSFMGGTAFLMWRLRRKLKDIPGTEQLANFCLTSQVTLMIFFIPNFFISRQNEDLVWHLVGISAGLAAMIREVLVEETEPVLTAEGLQPVFVNP